MWLETKHNWNRWDTSYMSLSCQLTQPISLLKYSINSLLYNREGLAQTLRRRVFRWPHKIINAAAANKASSRPDITDKSGDICGRKHEVDFICWYVAQHCNRYIFLQCGRHVTRCLVLSRTRCFPFVSRQLVANVDTTDIYKLTLDWTSRDHGRDSQAPFWNIAPVISCNRNSMGKTRKEATKGTQCFAINCQNYQNKATKSRGISFHK